MVAQFAKIERNPLLFPASNQFPTDAAVWPAVAQNGLIGK
jgi:hypothetical protein